jgi:tRNA(Ile2) C34 agmatinyltransferase TiaS
MTFQVDFRNPKCPVCGGKMKELAYRVMYVCLKCGKVAEATNEFYS